jgi:hypothetical protein
MPSEPTGAGRAKKAKGLRKAPSACKSKKPILDRLEPGEAQAVLNRLLADHPNIGAEAERIAESLLGEISSEIIADEIDDAIRSLDLDDLGSRAGRHSWGYTEPSEAAWKLLQEVVDPFLEDLKRRMDLGLAADALEVCRGILLGLYGVRDTKSGELVGWAPDFLEETAAGTVVTWCTHGIKSGAVRRDHARSLYDFAKESTPEWAALIKRVASRIR